MKYPPVLPKRITELEGKVKELREKKNPNKKRRRHLRVLESLKKAIKVNL